jgi:hypothetical protein
VEAEAVAEAQGHILVDQAVLVLVVVLKPLLQLTHQESMLLALADLEAVAVAVASVAQDINTKAEEQVVAVHQTAEAVVMVVLVITKETVLEQVLVTKQVVEVNQAVEAVAVAVADSLEPQVAQDHHGQ